MAQGDSQSSRSKIKRHEQLMSSPLLPRRKHKDSFHSDRLADVNFEVTEGMLEPDDEDDLMNEMWRSKPKLQRTVTNESMHSDSRQLLQDRKQKIKGGPQIHQKQ